MGVAGTMVGSVGCGAFVSNSPFSNGTGIIPGLV